MQALKEQTKKDSLPPMYKAVASVLREGKEKSITSTDIMRLVGLNDKRFVMEIIEQLINKHGYCIGTSRRGQYRGYYIISDKDKLTETLRTYNAQIQSMLKRHQALQKNWTNRDQLELEV